MLHELAALRELDKVLREYTSLNYYSTKIDRLTDALALVEEARDKDKGMPISVDAYGEYLRSTSFVGEGTGCYSTFEVDTAFTVLAKESPFGMALLELLTDDSAFEDEDVPEERRDITQRANLYASDNFFLAWYWEGDGTLLVGEHDNGTIIRAAMNGDCKKDYGWYWMKR